MIYYIADMHLGHNNVIKFDNRPYQNMIEMEEDFINRWNEKVKEKDTVYVLGDMFWKEDSLNRVLPQLKGEIILIKGNHDKKNFYVKNNIKVYDYLEIKDEGRNVVLCHFPIPCFNKHYYPNNYHLYGHVHDSWEWELMEKIRNKMETKETPCEMYNIGCMMPYMNYAPQTLNEIKFGYKIWKLLERSVEEIDNQN